MHPNHGKRRLLSTLLCLCLLMAATASAVGLTYDAVPHVLRPGKYYDIAITSPSACLAKISLLDAQGLAVHTLYEGFPLDEGPNALMWNGLLPDGLPVAAGEYTLVLETDDNGAVDAALRIGAPYPLLSAVEASTTFVDASTPVTVRFDASEAGTVQVDLTSYVTGQTQSLLQLPVSEGGGSFAWDGQMDGKLVPTGEYALVLTLQTGKGNDSTQSFVFVTVRGIEAEATPSIIVEITVPPEDEDALPPQTEDIPVPAAIEETAAALPQQSPPYSDTDDGTFWSMTPGELDDAVIWDILTQPIVVYDDGKIRGNEHVYLMENPDGTGAQVAQIHGKSQGIHLLGETNEHGYVYAETFSNYDPDYQPTTDEERAHAFDVKRGYIKASGLKTIEVKQDIAFLIDKLTQRMYMFVDGVRVTEFLIATGKIADNKYYNETIAGEYITISHVGGFWSGNMYCDMAIRINGGILLHEVPYKENADGSKNYASFEAYLGTKQSHGCIRIQRLKNPEGYNHRWIWENLDRKGGYKVVIWDDLNRYDSPTTWQENPKN